MCVKVCVTCVASVRQACAPPHNLHAAGRQSQSCFPESDLKHKNSTFSLKLVSLTHTHTHTHTRTHTQTQIHTHTHVCFCEKWGLSIGVMVFILYKLYVLLPYTYPTPKLSPHRRHRCISTFPKKTSLCMIYKRFEKWGHGAISS